MPGYELRAVLVHIGSTLLSGHYLAYVRVTSGWLCLDDASVTRASEGEVHAESAYMLFYEQCRPGEAHRQVRADVCVCVCRASCTLQRLGPAT